MMIRYADGRFEQGVVLSEDADTIRLAVRDAEDVLELKRVNAIYWATPDCEPVRLSFGGGPLYVPAEFDEQEFICPPDVAHLIIHGVPAEPSAHAAEPEAPANALPPIPEYGWDLGPVTIQ